MIIPVTITISPPPLPTALAQGITPESVPVLFPNTMIRLIELAQKGVEIWRTRALAIPGAEGRPLRLGTGLDDPMVRLNSFEYASSIAMVPVSTTQDGLEAVIATSDRQAIPIEIGGPEIDLHAILDYAPKARTGKSGKKYLLVPFRQATTAPGGPGGSRFQTPTNVIPPRILAVMRTKQRSQITGHYLEQGPNRAAGPYTWQGKVQRNVYAPGAGRLNKGDIAQAGLAVDSKQGQHLLGMIRIGSPQHGGYLTIRTLSQANKSGWRVRGYPAQQLANKTAMDLQRMAETWFDQALRTDAAGWVTEAVA